MTLKNPNLPDAGWDPIASDTVPFSGDFYMAPTSAMHVDNITNSQQGDKVSLNSNFVVTGDTTLNKTLTVSKKTTLNDELDVKGYSHFFDNVLIDKNATVEKNFYVSGEEAKIKNYLEVLGYEYITGADDDNYGLKVDNKIYAGGIDLTGDLVIDGNCYVTQEITASTGEFEEVSAQSATADVLYVTQHLSAVSATFHNIDITASEGRGFVVTGYAPGETVPVNYFEVPTTPFTHGDKNVYLDKVGLFVDGWTVLSGDTLLHRKLNVSGDSTLSTLSVTGNSDLDGNLDVGGTLTVTGATTLGSTLGVTGATTLNNTLNVSGKTTVSNEIVAASSITTNKNLYVSGGANISNFGKFGGYVYVSGADNDGYGLVVEKKANIKGDIIIGGDLDVTGDSTFVNTYITGDATINNLSVTGNATAQTQPPGTRTTQIATTEFVQQEISNLPDPYRIVSRNGRTEVVSNQDGTASIIDNESGQKGINVPEGFDFTGITPIESGDISLVGPYEIQGRWYWLPSTVDPETFDPSSTVDIHVVLGGVTSDEPNYVIVGFLAAYNITGWNTDSATLTRTQSEQAYQHGDITVCDIASEKTLATTDQIPTDIVSHQELDDALFNKVSQNAQFRMSIKDDGKVVVSGCRYRSANSTTQPFSNTYCVVSSENSLFDGGGGKIDFKIFNSTNGELLYRAVGYATGNWTVLQNNLTSEAASYLPNVGGNIQFPIIITTNPENKVLEVYLTGSGRVLQPWSNFTSWADSKTKTLATLQNIAPDFSMDSTYEVGDYVTYDGSLWKCKVAVTTAGQWTESDNWEQFIVMDEINSKIGDINSVLDAINGEEI